MRPKPLIPTRIDIFVGWPALPDGGYFRAAGRRGEFRAAARGRRLGVFLIVSAASRCVFSASTGYAGALLPEMVSVVRERRGRSLFGAAGARFAFAARHSIGA